MKDSRLTEHFTLREFERSAVAEANGIDNSVPSQYVPALQQLCQECLEPLRAFANSITPHKQGEKEGVPIIISSGYRCNQLNIKVGGAYASQHTLGEAADIQIPKTPYTSWKDNRAHTDMDILSRWFEFLTTHTDFDQAIIETANDLDYWIHISCRKNKARNRHQIIRYMHK